MRRERRLEKGRQGALCVLDHQSSERRRKVTVEQMRGQRRENESTDRQIDRQQPVKVAETGYRSI